MNTNVFIVKIVAMALSVLNVLETTLVKLKKSPKREYSSMDRVSLYESDGAGSIPATLDE